MLFEGKYLEEYDSLRTKISTKYPKYDCVGLVRENNFISKCYNGCGFVAYRSIGYKENELYNGYDLNSAYTSFLLKEKYPLSWKCLEYECKGADGYPLEEWIQEMGDDLWCAEIHFVNLKQTQPGYDYNIYYSRDCNTQILRVWPDGSFETEAFLTSVDLFTLKTIYKWDEAVVKRGYRFTDVGYMPDDFKEVVLREYEKVKQMKVAGLYEDAKKRKLMIEILTYGKSAARNYEKIEQYGMLIRNKRIPIAVFQVAYVRRYMAWLFLKYKESVLQIDTDGIVLKNDVIFEEYNKEDEKTIGAFKQEFNDAHCIVVRPKAYIVFDNKHHFIKYKFNGLKYPLTKAQLNELFENHTIKVTEDRNFKQEDGSVITKDITFNVDWVYDYQADKLKFQV